jgi:2-oxo-3-hexenedioate decarboxylase
VDIEAIAEEVRRGYATRQVIATPFSAREGGLDMPAAYAVAAALVRRRGAEGHGMVGRKVGYANKAVWRALKLETLVWAPMYDDTVVYADAGQASVGLRAGFAPKIEPEVVFKLGEPLGAVDGDPAAALGAVEWMALGFELVDSVFADWKFQPADFVAAYGLHVGLVVGMPRPVEAVAIPELVEGLARCTVQLRKNGDVAAEGAGRNVLRSPALCLAELASAVAGKPNQPALDAGEVITTGSTTDPQFVEPGQTWTMQVGGLDLPDLTLALTAAGQ